MTEKSTSQFPASQVDSIHKLLLNQVPIGSRHRLHEKTRKLAELLGRHIQSISQTSLETGGPSLESTVKYSAAALHRIIIRRRREGTSKRRMCCGGGVHPRQELQNMRCANTVSSPPCTKDASSSANDSDEGSLIAAGVKERFMNQMAQSTKIQQDQRKEDEKTGGTITPSCRSKDTVPSELKTVHTSCSFYIEEKDNAETIAMQQLRVYQSLSGQDPKNKSSHGCIGRVA